MADAAFSAQNDGAQVKTCTKCGESKPFSEYYSQKDAKYGLTPQCKKCMRRRTSAYRAENPEKVRAAISAWSMANPEKVKAYGKAHYEANSELIKGRSRQWREENPGKQEEQKAAFKEANPDKLREQAKRRAAKRLATPKGKVENSVRSLIHKWIRRGTKGGRPTFSLLGYSSEDLKNHLERQFLDGMTWENYGPVWHIDHILPLASFSYETPDCDGFKAAWAITNLRPLWAKDNIKKGAKVAHLL
jgi:hypothetical protein